MYAPDPRLRELESLVVPQYHLRAGIDIVADILTFDQITRGKHGMTSVLTLKSLNFCLETLLLSNKAPVKALSCTSFAHSSPSLDGRDDSHPPRSHSSCVAK